MGVWGLTGMGIIWTYMRTPVCPLPTASELGLETSPLGLYLIIIVTLVIAVMKSLMITAVATYSIPPLQHILQRTVSSFGSPRSRGGGRQDKELGQVFI